MVGFGELRGRGVMEGKYLDGPADCAEGSEDVGCDWDVHF